MAHALITPSGSHRWMNCIPSVRLEEQFPEETSIYAEEGTLAHAICEVKASGLFLNRDVSEALTHCQEQELYNPEMEGYTDEYVEYLEKKSLSYPEKPFIAIEKKVDLSKYIPEGFGTCDAVMIYGDTITVCDFKYGKGVKVDAEKNSQMMIYALGAYETYKLLYGIKNIEMAIIQPRIDNISEWTCTLDDLLAFGEEVKEKAELAFKGEGEFNPGDWCTFCKARNTCRARSDDAVKLAFEDKFEEQPELLSNDEIGRYIELGARVSAWYSDLKDYALSECLAGRSIDGYKAVEGRSTRSFDDTDKAFQDLIECGVEETMLYERKPLSVAKIEKMIGKKDFNMFVGNRVVKTPGKPTLAPESDKRKAITTVEQAFSE